MIRIVAWAAALAAFAGTGITFAQEYPVRPIRLIVPFAAGGSSDLLGRLVGARLTEALGQTVVVDNRGGAGGTLGATLAAQAPADGYTLLIHHVGLAINETLYPGRKYNALKDLAPISGVGVTPNAVVVAAGMPARSFGELVAMARKAPGKYNYGSGGVGSAGHLAVALLEHVASVKFNHVPFKGGGPSVAATAAGEVHFAIPAFPTAVPLTKAGKLRMLAVTGAKRSPTLPDVPTAAEAGVPGYDFVIWFGTYAPAGTPAAIVSRLNRVIVKGLESPEMREQVAKAGVEPEPSSSAELARLLRSEAARWAKIIKSAGIPVN